MYRLWMYHCSIISLMGGVIYPGKVYLSHIELLLLVFKTLISILIVVVSITINNVGRFLFSLYQNCTVFCVLDDDNHSDWNKMGSKLFWFAFSYWLKMKKISSYVYLYFFWEVPIQLICSFFDWTICFWRVNFFSFSCFLDISPFSEQQWEIIVSIP